MNSIEVRLVFDFDVDISDLDPKDVDLRGLAKESALRELKSQLDLEQITEEDFEIISEK